MYSCQGGLAASAGSLLREEERQKGKKSRTLSQTQAYGVSTLSGACSGLSSVSGDVLDELTIGCTATILILCR